MDFCIGSRLPRVFYTQFFRTWAKNAKFANVLTKIVVTRATKISKVLFQSVEYIHRRTQMITARVAAIITFYRIANSAL
jgi:hypothetical protein